MLKETTSYKYKRVEYKELEEEIRIWNTGFMLFFETDLIVMYNDIFDMYLTFNEEKQKVELVIYSQIEH